ncbi:DUF6798 domain-containing protein [Leifsonia sp. NPDC056824]|uniref:DUF6798 domain-containing protein n=1 Tax=Leifsonia sp. NPDC056824 TaxID=3345953 RepID=UPI00369E28FF
MNARTWAATAGRYARGPVGIALSMAVLLGALEVWGNQGPGYFAGWGDHFVLSPEGLSWAIPGAFANDWFMETSPQPHWFFDIVTWAGQASGHLSTAYTLFWAVGLLAFGAATALMAGLVARRAAWPVAVGFTFLISQTPWEIGGTGSLVIAQALPAVTSASLIYLALAALLANRRWLAAVAAVLVAIVHVQEGAVIAIVLVAFTVVDVIRARRVDWRLVGAIGVTLAFVVFGLALRPVASNLTDFVAICDAVIPYHCAAHLWNRHELASAIGLIVLTGLSCFLLPRRARVAWLVTVGLATLGYTLGFAADALSVPVLGQLAQAVNVYRLGVVLLPFAIWGALLPVLKPEWSVWGFVRLVAWWLALAGLLASPFNRIPATFTPAFLAIAGTIAVCALLAFRFRGRLSRPFLVGLSSFLLGLLFVFTAAGTGALTFRTPDFRFISSQTLVQWGEEVRAAVPAGAVIVSSPRDEWTKLVTQRAVVADCKDVPYGGAPWREWKRRIGQLGGLEQCQTGVLLYNELSAGRLIGLADEFHSDFITLNPSLSETAEGLKARGWHLLVQPVGTSGVLLFGRSA